MDILVNNAGFCPAASTADLADDDLDAMRAEQAVVSAQGDDPGTAEQGHRGEVVAAHGQTVAQGGAAGGRSEVQAAASRQTFSTRTGCPVILTERAQAMLG